MNALLSTAPLNCSYQKCASILPPSKSRATCLRTHLKGAFEVIPLCQSPLTMAQSHEVSNTYWHRPAWPSIHLYSTHRMTWKATHLSKAQTSKLEVQTHKNVHLTSWLNYHPFNTSDEAILCSCILKLWFTQHYDYCQVTFSISSKNTPWSAPKNSVSNWCTSDTTSYLPVQGF